MLSDGRGDQENNEDILRRNTYSKGKQKKAKECLVCKQPQSLSRVPTLSQPYGQQSALQVDE